MNIKTSISKALLPSLVSIVLSLISLSTYASVDCPAAKVLNLQPQRGSILVKLQGQNWHRVGKPDHPGVQAMYAALLAAQMAGKKVTIRYPDGYNCKAYELRTDALMVRTHS